MRYISIRSMGAGRHPRSGTPTYRDRQMWDRKTENKTGFPFIVLKLASSVVRSDGSYLDAAYTTKSVLFAHSTSPLPGVLASQGTDHDKT